jgi:MFS-type transporter involved in bile tolerance (Atg22 family)
MIEQISVYLTSMILGIMLFFSFVIAPVVFTTLDENNARKFIRRIFPFYYNVNLGISFIVLMIFILLSKIGVDFYLILAITVLFATSNYLLMPLINKYRDEKQDKKFKYSHFLSVLINFVQMICLVFVLV